MEQHAEDRRAVPVRSPAGGSPRSPASRSWLPFLCCSACGLAVVTLSCGRGDGGTAAGKERAIEGRGAPARPPFVEVAAEVGLDFIHMNGMSGELYYLENVGAGLALFDYDGDGDLDVFLPQGHMLGEGKTIEDYLLDPPHQPPYRDRLYRNELVERGELAFTDVTEGSGIEEGEYGMGVAVGDVDNDGCLDLYVLDYGPNRLWRNRCDGTFTDATEATGTGDPSWGVSATFLDYDRDGWLDLYVANYLDFDPAAEIPCFNGTGRRDYCGPLTYEPAADRLYHNRGDGTFEELGRAVGVGGERGAGMGTLAVDFDEDGWLDLYVGNDGTPNLQWMNRGGGVFEEGAGLAGTAVNREGRPQASMGIDAGDYDGDGDLDLFLAHLTTEHNTLYENLGKGFFSDRSMESGLATPSWQLTGFGTAWIDYDGDTRLDLLVVNGAVATIDELARRGDVYPLHQRNQLFRNRGDGTFEETTAAAGPAFELSEVSRGAAFGDVDNDGDVDVVVSNSAGPVRLLLNQNDPHTWVGLRLLLADHGRDDPGARVALLRADGPPIWRRVRMDGSYASASDPRVTVPLPEGTRITAVRVVWSDGSVEQWPAPEPGRYVDLVRGSGTPAGDRP